MTAQAKVKIYVSGGRHSINLPGEFVRDSAFPFKPLEELVARIDGKKKESGKPRSQPSTAARPDR